MAKRVKIPGRLESAETGNIVTGADAVMDDAKGKTQVVINSEVDAAIISLAQGKQDALTFDSAPTEGSPNPVTSAGVYTADKVLSDAIEAILLLIPSAASALNKLVDMQTMNSSIATATASFKGTYNLVSDLHLGVDATHEQIGAALDALSLGADNNDYAFVQVPNSSSAPTEIRVTERYKYNGTNWLFEYDLNNSGFTQGQWNAINSGVTSLLVGKLSGLPTDAELTALLAGKQDNLTFDNVPTAGSPNPVKSGGVYARNNEIVALINALDAAKQDVLTFDNTPVEGSPNPVKSGGVYTAISAVQAAVVALDAEKQNVLTFDSTPTLGSFNPVTSSGIKTELNRIDGNITTLNDLYEALTQSALVVVQPSDTWPVASPATKTIYRVVDRVNTPPQYYSDYMWNGSTMVPMAQYDNAIDDVPTAGSNNLVKSGGVFDNVNAIQKKIGSGKIIFSYTENGSWYRSPDGTKGGPVEGLAIDHYSVVGLVGEIHIKCRCGAVGYILFFDKNGNVVYYIKGTGTEGFDIDDDVILPNNCVTFGVTYATELGNYVTYEDNGNFIEKLGHIVGSSTLGNIYLQSTEVGFYNDPSGSITPSSDFRIAHYVISGIVSAIHIRARIISTSYSTMYILFFDNNENIIKAVAGKAGSGYTFDDDIEIPSDCTHFGVSSVVSDGFTETTTVIDWGLKKEVENINFDIYQQKTNGIKIGLLGDSIAAAADSFINECAEIIGATVKNAAIAGWFLGDYENHSIYKQVNGLSPSNKSLDGDENLVVIFAGTNDFGHAFNIGEAYTEETTSGETRKVPSTVINETCGGLVKTIKELYEKYNGYIPIIICTPLQRLSSGGNSQDPGTPHAPEGPWAKNSIGKYLDDYCDAIKSVAQLYGIPVFDAFNINMNPNIPGANIKYFADGLHPNTYGQNYLGKCLAAFIKNHIFDY